MVTYITNVYVVSCYYTYQKKTLVGWWI